MKILFTLIIKELETYINNKSIYIDLIIFSLSLGICVFLKNKNSHFLSDSLMINIPYLLIIIISNFSIAMFIKEKNLFTLELLRCFPIDEDKIVISKFLSASIYSNLILILLIPLMWILFNENLVAVIYNFIGIYLLTQVFLVIGSFFSSICNSHSQAFIISIFTSFFLYNAQSISIVFNVNEYLSNLLNTISLKTHYLHIINEINFISSCLYLLSLTFLFLYFTTQSFKQKQK